MAKLKENLERIKDERVDKINEIIKLKKISKTFIAESVGIRRAHLYKILNGRHPLSYGTYAKISEFLKRYDDNFFPSTSNVLPNDSIGISLGIMPEKVEMYECTDGTLFKSEKKAFLHQFEIIKNAERMLNKLDFSTNGKKIEYIDFFSYEEIKNKKKKLPEIPGIYMEYNILSSLAYIGSTKNIKNRCGKFFGKNEYAGTKIETDRKKKLKYYLIFILKEVKDLKLLEYYENYYINFYDTIENGYNCSKAVGHFSRNVNSENELVMAESAS